MMDSLFEIDPVEQRRNIHSCTGTGCSFCEFVEGTTAKRKGTDAVIKDPEWHLRATEWRRSLSSGKTITADHLIEACGHPEGSPNQIGALFRSWAVKGLVKVRGSVSSTRNTNHARKIIIWEVNHG